MKQDISLVIKNYLENKPYLDDNTRCSTYFKNLTWIEAYNRQLDTTSLDTVCNSLAQELPDDNWISLQKKYINSLSSIEKNT